MKNGKKLNMNRWTFKSKQSVILKIILKCNNQSLLCLIVHTCILITGESTRELEVQASLSYMALVSKHIVTYIYFTLGNNALESTLNTA